MFVPASPTSLGTYLTCPRQFQAKYITKEVVFQPTAASEHGDRGHKALEARLKFGTPLPEEFEDVEPFAAAIESRDGDLYLEQRLPWTRDGRACTWRDRYAGGIADWLLVAGDRAWLGDYKFGKYKTDPLQLHILILGVFAHFPDVQHVTAALIFMRTGQLFEIEAGREDVTLRTVAADMARYEAAQESGAYPPRPNGLCRQWCQVRNCVFHGRGSR